MNVKAIVKVITAAKMRFTIKMIVIDCSSYYFIDDIKYNYYSTLVLVDFH